MNEETPLTIVPADLAIEADWQRANKVAELCKAIVEATAVNIRGQRYVRFEGWQSITAANGYTLGTEEPQRTEDGYRAKAYLKRDLDGMIVSTAYGFVGDDEPTWAKRPRHANESMCQTRAMARCAANKFRFILVLMKIENLATTPFEEMTETEDDQRKDWSAKTPPARPKPQPRAQPQRQAETFGSSSGREPEPPAETSRPDINGGRQNAEGGNTTTLSGVVTKCRPSEFDGRTYYWAEIEGRTLFTVDKTLGKQLLEAEDNQIEALVRPGKKPNRFVLIDFHLPIEEGK